MNDQIDSNNQSAQEPVALFHAKWLENSLTIGAAEAGAELKRLYSEVQRLTQALKQANSQAEHFEREWYLRGDQIEAIEKALSSQEALFWYRPVGEDGGYEGPIHHSKIESVRNLPSVWVPLVPASPDSTPLANYDRAGLLWVLYNHQGGSSPVGQPIRAALGIGPHKRLTDEQIEQAKLWAQSELGIKYER